MHKDQTFWVTAKVQDGCADSQTNITAQPAEMKPKNEPKRAAGKAKQKQQSRENKVKCKCSP